MRAGDHRRTHYPLCKIRRAPGTLRVELAKQIDSLRKFTGYTASELYKEAGVAATRTTYLNNLLDPKFSGDTTIGTLQKLFDTLGDYSLVIQRRHDPLDDIDDTEDIDEEEILREAPKKGRRR